MINCIVAIEKDQGIGYNNSMPWPNLSEDMKWFKSLTTNNVVIMGSNTWYSLKKKLPNRVNIVISKTDKAEADYTFQDVHLAIEFSKKTFKDKDIFIIGGQQLYDSCMTLIDNFYITEIDHNYTCDKFFNFNFVRNNFKNINLISSYTTPINFTIKEYKK